MAQATIRSAATEAGSVSIQRQASLRAVFEAMLASRTLSRAELARRTGLSKQTTSEVMRRLEAAGWIRLTGKTHGPVGRRATTYELVGANACVLGVDLGGTKVHVALADLFGDLIGEATESTHPAGGRHIVAQIDGMVRVIAAKAGLDVARIRRGALGSPGVVQPATGHILYAPNIPGLDTFDVADALAVRLGFPVVIENDVNLAALGERRQGDRHGVGNLAFIALGTGIGMGIVANGQLLRGARGAAGEIAYLPLGGDPFDSRGFTLGTFETVIGSVAIVERCRGLGVAAPADVRGVFDLLAQGDAAAAMVIDEVARLLAQAIVAVRAVLDPEIVVLGGSIGSRQEVLEGVRRYGLRLGDRELVVESSLLGSRAALIGAIGLATDLLHRELFEPPRSAPEAGAVAG